MATQDIDREISASIGLQLKTARKLKGISQKSLAAALGVTFQQVQKYEIGTNRISAPMLVRAAKFLDQPVVFFLPTEQRKKTRIPALNATDIQLVLDLRYLPDDIKRTLRSLLRQLIEHYRGCSGRRARRK